MSAEKKNMDVRLEFTPNPNALKYMVDEHVFVERGTANFTDRHKAEASPLAKRVMAIPGVVGCMIGRNYVTISTVDGSDLEQVDELTRKAILDHIGSGKPAVEPIHLTSEAPTVAGAAVTLEGRIREVLDRDIRPAVAMDGGDIVFEKFENGVVYLYMQGSCAGCPSSTATLKMGIEARLQQVIPEVREVVAL